jgi:hypothetical protein
MILRDLRPIQKALFIRYKFLSLPKLNSWVKLREMTGIPKVINSSFRKKNVIYIHIPKCAGSSIGMALLGSDIIGHYPWFVYQNYNQDFYSRAFKFSIIRNPTERFESAYYYLLTGGKGRADQKLQEKIQRTKCKDINDFVCNHLDEKMIYEIIHFAPQSDFILNEKGEIQVNLLFTMNNMKLGIARLKEVIKLDYKLSKNNRTKEKSTKLNSNSIVTLKEVYKKDFGLYDKYKEEVFLNNN